MLCWPKWLWRFGRERDSLLCRVVVACFGEQSVWASKTPHGRHGCGIWKSILKGNERFWRFIIFHLGSGHEISFWQDPWVRECPLKDRFASMFSLVEDKWGSVFSCFDFESNVWCPKMRRNLYNWEIGEFGNLLSHLERYRPVLNRNDSMVWKPSKNGNFSSKSCYKVFSNWAMISPFPSRRIWNTGIPSKVSFFMWNAYLDKILTLNHL